MNHDTFEWVLLLGRWLHITVAVTWIGTSIFFMWLDRTLRANPQASREGHVGELWMVHGGGFYHVEKLLMGPTKAPPELHWFKWEAYWTWMSGIFLVVLIFYTGDGTFLLDPDISSISYLQGVLIGIFSLVGSWFFYDFLWERQITKNHPVFGHFLTLLWLTGMSYFLCHTLSGRAAYVHIGGMLGTWMTANVFLRIIPRQIKMVEASSKGEAVHPDWGKNAKNRSTHNTYFTLPVIFIMLSNHFPLTYGHEYNWVILLFLCVAGAAIREFFVVRIKNPSRAYKFAGAGISLIVALMIFTVAPVPAEKENPEISEAAKAEAPVALEGEGKLGSNEIRGTLNFQGEVPKGTKLSLPGGCSKGQKGDVYSDEVIVNDGKLQNVLVRVTKGLVGNFRNVSLSGRPVELDQRGCVYHPRVVAARVGQEVVFINSDALFHNVKSVSTHNPNFNLAMPRIGQRETRVFQAPEIFLQAKCNVHPWMRAYVAVVDHPFYDVTDEKGEFTLSQLPAGSYTLEVWHEVFGSQEKEITVGENEKVTLDFTFK